MMRKKFAFTLSEVLVTLMLVAVVAVIIMPYLVSNFNKSKWTLLYKRTFAETYNNLAQLALDDDCEKSLTCTHLFDLGRDVSTKNFGDAFTKIYSVSHVCPMSKDTTKCFPSKVKNGLGKDSVYETLQETMSDVIEMDSSGSSESDTGGNNAANNTDGFNFYTFKTTRGVSYALYSFGNKCLNAESDMTETEIQEFREKYVLHADQSDNPMLSLCGFIIVDVNGEHPPNTWGRDVFGMWVTDRNNNLGIYSFGEDNDKKFHGACNVDNTQEKKDRNNNNAVVSQTVEKDTRGCAAKLIKDGWKMTY